MYKKASGAQQRKRKALQIKEPRKSIKLLQTWCKKATIKDRLELPHSSSEDSQSDDSDPSSDTHKNSRIVSAQESADCFHMIEDTTTEEVENTSICSETSQDSKSSSD